MSNDIDIDASLFKIILHYGLPHQMKKLAEEEWELNEAIIGHKGLDAITEEIADCYVLLEQIRMYNSVSLCDVVTVMQQKTKRQLKRIEKELERENE